MAWQLYAPSDGGHAFSLYVHTCSSRLAVFVTTKRVVDTRRILKWKPFWDKVYSGDMFY